MFTSLTSFIAGATVGFAIAGEPLLTLTSVGTLVAAWGGAIAFKLDRREETR